MKKKTLGVAGILVATVMMITSGVKAQSPAAYPQQVSATQPGLPAPASVPANQMAPPRLDAIMANIQKTALSLNANLGKLRIEKWRTDPDQKEQLQKLANSLQRNVTHAVPGLISDVQNSRGSVTSTFKLYHDVNVVYDYLNSLADAAGSLGRREEYEPLAADAAALDSVREHLSNYIEQTATLLETPKPSVNAVSTAEGETIGGGHKIIVEEVSTPAKPRKKKTSAAPANASSKTTPASTPSKATPAKPSPAKPARTATAATVAVVPAATPAPK